jgi:DNA invertase Pin-like site-specific DNA recombinase
MRFAEAAKIACQLTVIGDVGILSNDRFVFVSRDRIEGKRHLKAVPYYRKSTNEQAESGAGQAAQHDACEACARRLGIPTVDPCIDDGVSGAAPLDKRPGLLDALAKLQKGDILLVAKRDRLGRDPIVVAMIEAAVQRQECRIVSAAGEGTEGDDPTSVLMRRIIDAFAEYERLIIKARTRAALAAKKRRGQRTGGVPLGFDLTDDGTRSKAGRPIALTTNTGEQATVARIEGYQAVGLSLRAIADELTRQGVRTKSGLDRWDHSTVRKILHRTP